LSRLVWTADDEFDSEMYTSDAKRPKYKAERKVGISTVIQKIGPPDLTLSSTVLIIVRHALSARVAGFGSLHLKGVGIYNSLL
jgi:hypothetical protein